MGLHVGLTTITGPNGVGKTNLTRCIDLAVEVLGGYADSAKPDSLYLYSYAGRHGADHFSVSLGLRLDQEWEKDLLLDFVRATILTFNNGGPVSLVDLDEMVRTTLDRSTTEMLWEGTIHIRFDADRQFPWQAAWEFDYDGEKYHIGLVGLNSNILRYGPAFSWIAITGTESTLTERLLPGLFVVPQFDPSTPMPDIAGDFILAAGAIDFQSALHTGTNYPLHATWQPSIVGRMPTSFTRLGNALGMVRAREINVDFVHIIQLLLRRGLIFMDNARTPLRERFDVDELGKPRINLRDGGNVSAELFRLRNGDAAQQNRYRGIKETFNRLTGMTLGLQTVIEPAEESGNAVVIIPIVNDGQSGRPIGLAGAGVQEALIIATLLSGEAGRVTILDEPAVNLAPLVQRRLIGILRRLGQCLVVTHSAELVLVDSASDIQSIVRLRPSTQGAELKRPRHLQADEARRWIQVLTPAHVRALLFASGVVLCEGDTEVGALSFWWKETSIIGLPNPEISNIAIIDVGGDARFNIYVDYLDAFGIPWAIVADGPALKPGSKLETHLTSIGRCRNADQPAGLDFGEWLDYWRASGVFTVADNFGDTGKAGEFEAYLAKLSQQDLLKARMEVGRSKPRVGALFAQLVNAPEEILKLYRDIRHHLAI